MAATHVFQQTASRLLILAALLTAPLCAMVYLQADGMGIRKQGAGLVLYVTLQRQSMS